MPTINQSLPLFRAPNGAAPQRLRVALPEGLLAQIKDEAAKNRRTVSSMASLIIAEYYDAKPSDSTVDKAKS
jgi:hypothetical protein